MHIKGEAGIIGSQVKMDEFRICLNVACALGKKRREASYLPQCPEGINHKRFSELNAVTSLFGLTDHHSIFNYFRCTSTRKIGLLFI